MGYKTHQKQTYPQFTVFLGKKSLSIHKFENFPLLKGFNDTWFRKNFTV